MSLVVGLTGPNASGKGEVGAYLAVRGFALHSLSDIVREEAAALGLVPTREHLIRIGNRLRKEGGAGVLAERILPRLGDWDVVDSIRNPAEVAALGRRPDFVLLGVRAPLEARFERSLARARPGDPLTVGEFRGCEAQENTTDPTAQRLEATFRLADRILENDGDIVQLRSAVDDLLAELETPHNR